MEILINNKLPNQYIYISNLYFVTHHLILILKRCLTQIFYLHIMHNINLCSVASMVLIID